MRERQYHLGSDLVSLAKSFRSWRAPNHRSGNRGELPRLLPGYQLEFEFAGGSKPASFQTERFSKAAINFTKAHAVFGAALSVVAAAP
jgi:hypothetical protein